MNATSTPSPSVNAHWEHFHHGADIGVRGIGTSEAHAFELAALALSAVITDPASVVARTPVAIACAAPDNDLLFCDWLNALIYEMSTRKMLFSRFQVQLRDGHLSGTAWGEPIDRARHAPAVEVKGATLTELRVEQRGPEHWIAQCVVDV